MLTVQNECATVTIPDYSFLRLPAIVCRPPAIVCVRVAGSVY